MADTSPSILQSPSQPAPLALPAPPKPVTRRRIGDIPATRKMIYDNVLQAASSLKPLANSKNTLSVHDVAYEDPDDFPLSHQKQIMLSQRSLHRRLRGTWKLTDNETGKTLDEKRTTLVHVPHMTQRGTFIVNGNEYVLSNQLRLRPGVYSRRKENGELEAHVNVLPGKGQSHRLFLDPETGVFRMNIGQANIPLLPVLRAMGVTDTELKRHWGDELLGVNRKHDSASHLEKLHGKLVRKVDPNATPENRREAVAKALSEMELDPEVNKHTLGFPHAKLTKEALLDTSKKLIKLNRGEIDPDDRDHMAYQLVMGPEDLMAERIGKDRGSLHKLLWQSTFRGNLGHVQPGTFNKSVMAGFLSSGLGSLPEGINGSEFLDHAGRVTRLGEGGIGSSESIPYDSRNVHPSQFGFIDPIKTVESNTAGVDLRLAYGVQKGSDNRLYAPFRETKTGRTVYRSPQDLASLTIAFPGELASARNHVAAIDKGRMKFVPRSQVDLEAGSMEQAFSPLSNLVPLKSALKGQRGSMGARMLTQALPVVDPEAPHVRGSVPGQPGRSFAELYGRHMGAVNAEQDGRVLKTTKDGITVQHADGSTKQYEMYNEWPGARKTGLTSTAVVQPGDQVRGGQLLARSNYTNDRGEAALGVNTPIAYIPSKTGSVYEDSATISESYAKRLTSEHYYQHKADFGEGARQGKSTYISLFPGKYEKKTLDKLDEHGVIKPGSKVSFGDPLILMAKEREMDHGKVTQSSRSAFSDSSTTWDHHTDGVVTDVIPSKHGTNVVVKTYAPMKVGDKLCYDAETEVLTDYGWKPVHKLSLWDDCATLNPDGQLEYVRIKALHRYDHDGPMYSLQTTQADLLVTENHKLYAAGREGTDYRLTPAKDLYGKRYRLKNNCDWVGKDPEYVEIHGVKQKAGQGGVTTKVTPPLRLEPRAFAMLLGAFLSEGCTIWQPASGTYGLDIAQKKLANRAKFKQAIKESGLKFSEVETGFRCYSIRLQQYFKQFGYSYKKFIPNEVFSWSKETLQVLFEWLMWGDGSATGSCHSYCTTSKQLANDFQRLCLHIGYGANIKMTKGGWKHLFGREKLTKTRDRYDVYVYRKKNRPTINHGHARDQLGQIECWENYTGSVYCPELPRNHILYVRRNGKAVWCGNSNTMGGKSVVAEIIPDHQMPHNKDGEPFSMLWSPLSLNSRINPTWAIEAALGKIAAKTGQPYTLEDWGKIPNLSEFALKELEKHGLSDTETIVDPVTGRHIPNVLTGVNYIMKLHHTADSKSQGRGLGAYSAEGTPLKGGSGQAKRLSLGDTTALLSHGSYGVLRDSREHRSQRNDEFWLAYMGGFPPPHPKVPYVYEKFINELKGSGINVVREGPRLRLMALTNKDIQALSGNRELKNADTVRFDRGLEEVPGGLFDKTLTGGNGGNQWSKISIVEPYPNPIFAEPIRRLLGMTEKRYLNVIAGHEDFNGTSGPSAISKALESIDVPKSIDMARRTIESGKKSSRDDAIRRLSYLKSLEKTGQHPKDWMLAAVPVLPPLFRPVSTLAGGRSQMIADPNLLYKELFDANENLKSLHGKVADLGEERLALYKAFEAVIGLGDPTHPKNVERGVKGLLANIFGPSAKVGFVQSKLLGTNVDMAGRAVIAPDADMDMDHVGLPENSMFDVFKPFIVREMVRNGMPRVQALKEIEERTKGARDILLQVSEKRPVLLNRYPLLHRYGLMAFWAKPVHGDTIKMPPLVYKGFGADNDGDAMQFHVPVADYAVKDAVDKMLPSKNLFSAATFKAHYLPSMEYLQGLHAASTSRDEAHPKVYRTKAEATAAYKRGEISLGQQVEILEH